MKRVILMVASLTLLLGSAGGVKAQLITNGGFETGDFTGWTTGGNFENTEVAAFYGTYVPYAGSYFALLGPGGSDGTLSQTFATTVGQTYQLSLFLASDGFTPNDFSANVGGPNIINLPTVPYQTYVNYTADFMAMSSSTTLTLAFRNDPGFLSLDNVSVNAVPEPSGLALLGLGIACLTVGYVVRRKTVALTAA